MGTRILNQGLDSRVLDLAPNLRNGWSPTFDNRGANTPFLDFVRGLKCTPNGLGVVSGISNEIDAFTPDFTVNWPLPQLYRGKEITLNFVDNGTKLDIYQVTEHVDPWTQSELTVYDITATTTPLEPLTGGGQFHVADFRKAWLATNGSSLLVKLPNYNSFAVMVATDPTVRTCAASNNRLYLGTITAGAGNWFADSRWTDLFTAWQERAAEQFVTYDTMAMQENYLMFSEYAGGQINYPFITLMAALGWSTSADFDAIRENIIQSTELGLMGLMPLPFQGKVDKIMQLGQHTMVYGGEGAGIYALDPENRMVPVLDVGIGGRGCVGGDEFRHVFLDESDRLWTLDSQLQLEQLHFGSAMTNLTKSEVVINYDPEERDYFISDGLVAFLLNDENRLSQTNSAYSSVLRVRESGITVGGLVGFSKSLTHSVLDEMVTNGDFTGNADNWTLGTGWAYGTNEVDHTAGNTATMTQAKADFAITPFKTRLYTLSVTISNRTAGSITVSDGISTSDALNADGTHTFDLRWNGSSTGIVITPTSTFDGTVDDISLTGTAFGLSELRTVPFTSGVQGPDTIDRIEITDKAEITPPSIQVYVLARYSDESTVYQQHYLGTLDGRGIVRANITATEFKIWLRSSGLMRPQSIKVSFRSGGKIDLKNRLSPTETP